MKTVIEQRAVIVPVIGVNWMGNDENGQHVQDDFVATEVEEAAQELGFRVIDLDRIRRMLLAYAKELNRQARLVHGEACSSCGMIHEHVPSCSRFWKPKDPA
jgi:hypothetical protein